jgi:hypothetical protein
VTFGLDRALSAPFAGDPVVASLPMLHDLHPHDLRTRVEQAAGLLRAGLGNQVDLRLIEIRREIVRVRVEVAPSGCGTPLERIRTTVDAAIRQATPDVDEVQVEAAIRASEPPLIQLMRR